MTATAGSRETNQPAGAKGTPSVPVPWDKADELHRELRKRGHPSTLCLSVATRAARLEPWPGVDPRPALAALQELLAGESVGRRHGDGA